MTTVPPPAAPADDLTGDSPSTGGSTTDGSTADDAPAAWFLTADERGNPATRLDARRGRAWTDGNAVRVHVDGAAYFARLHEILCTTVAGDWVYFTDWQGDPDQVLVPPDVEIGQVLADLATRGVNVRGLLWRSHPRLASFSEEDNFSLSQRVNRAGGQVLLDHRVRKLGSHHQKLFVILRQHDENVAFLGGIDLCHGRRDDPRHLGDPQVVELDDDRYGERPPWHDIQLEVTGPAVHDVAYTFAERWSDPSPLDSPTPWRRLMHRAAAHPEEPSELAPDRIDDTAVGSQAVQLLRTYPRRHRDPYPFAPAGERSVARAYEKAFARARRLISIEDQYLWSYDAMRSLTDALRREPELRLVIVIPRYPDPDGKVAGAASRFGRMRVLDELYAAGGDRVGVYDLENREGTPIYVHAKLCVVDDLWMVVGSDNLNRRSWTHDSELSAAVIDTERDERAPADPAGSGDGARRLARDTRLRVACEHLGREDDDTDDLVDPVEWFDALRASARALDAWHAGGCNGPRPPGHLRAHPHDHVGRIGRPLAHAMHAWFLDPDGRPRAVRRRGAF